MLILLFCLLFDVLYPKTCSQQWQDHNFCSQEGKVVCQTLKLEDDFQLNRPQAWCPGSTVESLMSSLDSASPTNRILSLRMSVQDSPLWGRTFVSHLSLKKCGFFFEEFLCGATERKFFPKPEVRMRTQLCSLFVFSCFHYFALSITLFTFVCSFRGGIPLTVTGQNLDNVPEPIMVVIVVTDGKISNYYQVNYSILLIVDRMVSC